VFADAVAAACGDAYGVATEADVSRAGGGALPLTDIPTTVVTLAPATLSANQLEAALRLGAPTIVSRIRDDRVVIDPRTLTASEAELVVARLAEIASGK
jgi:L-seryl-tRNA(Ser) seleniumtransferase